MKLTYKEGLIFAPLTVSYGHQTVTVECIIDTGSAGTAIDTAQLSLDLSRPGIMADMVGIGGSHQVVIQTVEQVSLDGMIVANFDIEFGDFSGTFALKGIIGGDLLQSLGVVIDYHDHELRCYRSAPP